MAKLERPRGLRIDFKPSERQYEVWNALQPNHCDKCGGQLEMRPNGYDKNGHEIFQATCKDCGNTNIPEQILEGGSAGGGKSCLSTSYVVTPFGMRQLKDLNVGDIITDPTDGGMQKIIWKHPVGTFDFYRVSFIDGTHVDCSEGHLWQLHVTRKKTKKKDEEGNALNERVWTTKMIYEWLCKKEEGTNKGVNLVIPLTAPVQFTIGERFGKRSEFPHPYVVGALIGNGSMGQSAVDSKEIGYTSMDYPSAKHFEELGYPIARTYQNSGSRATTYFFKSKQLLDGLEKCGLLGHLHDTKFIPEYYKYATIEERKQLMQGLMDTDGYVDDRGHMSYCTTSEQLANDVAWVVRSLGGKATITSKIPTYTYKGEKKSGKRAYYVYIMTKFDSELVYIKRKKCRCRDEFNGGASELGKRIVGCEPIGKRTSFCITVDNPSGLYLTDDFTVTHNSYLGCCWLVSSCIRFEGIRMIVARKVRKTLLETTWKTLKNVLNEWKLVQDVNYKVNNVSYTITFWNGSEIMAMELTPSPQDPDFNSLGSLEITGGFIDEVSEVSEKAVEVLASRIRYKIAETFVVGKLLMSTNPCLTWVRSTFVMDDDGDPVTLQAGYRYIPFSLFDNPNKEFRAIYYNKLSKLRNKADRDRLLYGNWLFTTSNKMAAYWNFDGDKHIVQNLKERYYDPMKPLILSFDFNVNPYMSCLPIQIDYDNKTIYVFPEFVGCPKDKRNNTPAFTRWIASQLVVDGQVGGVLLTGDPAGLSRSTQTEEGVNNFTIANKNMTNAVLRPKVQLLNKQPAHITRLEFVNELLNGYDGWKLFMDARCHRLTEDMIYQKKNPDGTKEKKKVLNDDGDRVERYGHFSDCLDYALIYYLAPQYSQYKTSSVDIVTTIDMGETVYGDFDY